MDSPDPEHPLVANTRGFAKKFANVIPAPAVPEASAGVGAGCFESSFFVDDAATLQQRTAQWEEELYLLLMHLQA